MGATAQAVKVVLGTGAAAQNAAGFTSTFSFFDPRGRVNSTVIAEGSNNGFGTLVGQFATGVSPIANQMTDIIVTDIQEIPLLPGNGLQVVTSNVSQILNVIGWWRERLLEESERT